MPSDKKFEAWIAPKKLIYSLRIIRYRHLVDERQIASWILINFSQSNSRRQRRPNSLVDKVSHERIKHLLQVTHKPGVLCRRMLRIVQVRSIRPYGMLYNQAMKLLLTSNGLSNALIEDALETLVGKSRGHIKIAFIPTAAFPEDDKKHESRHWLVDDLYRIKEFCGFIDIVSLTDLPQDKIRERLEYVYVIFVGGGNTFYLSYWMEQRGVFDMLPSLLATRVYAGISAGSMIATSTLRSASQAIKNPDAFYDELYDEFGPPGQSSARTARLVDFAMRPHYQSFTFPKVQGDFLQAIADDVRIPLYAIGDNSALMVVDGRTTMVGGGEWKLFDVLG